MVYLRLRLWNSWGCKLLSVSPMDNESFNVISISESILGEISAPGFNARVLASFERACDLITQRGTVVAFVHPQIGNGPFNVVLGSECSLKNWSCGVVLTGDGKVLRIRLNEGDSAIIHFGEAVCWNPRPDWVLLSSGNRMGTNLDGLRSIASLNSVSESLMNLRSPEKSTEAWKKQAGICIDGIITSFRSGALDAYRNHVSNLCGLGIGLTPSGDDWLAGWMIGLRLIKPSEVADQNGKVILEAAQGRTTTLSLAFLHAAALGEVSEHWKQLLTVLPDGITDQVEAAASLIMDFGATSGSDMLAGFLSAATLCSKNDGLTF
jgi:hypothetical protein